MTTDEAPQTPSPDGASASTPAAQDGQAPEVKAPEAKAPETKAPEAKAPEAKAPETKAPETKAPETKAPETKAPETKAPEADKPVAGGRESDRPPDGERPKRRRSRTVAEAVVCRPLEVSVREDRVEQAIRQLKNRMAREGVLRELKNRRHYYKPSELKRIKSREAARRRRKQARQKPR